MKFLDTDRKNGRDLSRHKLDHAYDGTDLFALEKTLAQQRRLDTDHEVGSAIVSLRRKLVKEVESDQKETVYIYVATTSIRRKGGSCLYLLGTREQN